jgi:hypothetical protein
MMKHEYEQEQDDFLKNLFKSLPEEKLPASFVDDTMSRIRREAVKSKIILWILIMAGSVSAFAVAIVAGLRFLPGSAVARYANDIFSTVKKSFSVEIFPQTIPKFGLMIGAAVMILLFADLFFEKIIMKRR